MKPEEPFAPIERFAPHMKGPIQAEHFHRYALVGPLARDKDVLDLACGEGYGAAQLALVARSVVGVDNDAPTIEAAAKRYVLPHLSFQVGSCDSVPLPDASLDGVVSFETLEHHDRHDEMMCEVKRVLRPGGFLLISSPNRAAYSQQPDRQNPFHVRELSLAEFETLLRRHFRCVEVVGQKFAVASFVFSLDENEGASWTGYTSCAARLERANGSLQSPVYFVALCSDEPRAPGELGPSLYLDDEVINHHFAEVRAAKSALAKLHANPLWRVALRVRRVLRPRAR